MQSKVLIEDYFTLEKKVQHLEKENIELSQRLLQLEKVFNSNHSSQSSKSRIKSLYNNGKQVYNIYQQSRIIILSMCFLFGNKILTNQWIIKKIYGFIVHKIK